MQISGMVQTHKLHAMNGKRKSCLWKGHNSTYGKSDDSSRATITCAGHVSLTIAYGVDHPRSGSRDPLNYGLASLPPPSEGHVICVYLSSESDMLHSSQKLQLQRLVAAEGSHHGST